jgi:hypothetical protein
MLFHSIAMLLATDVTVIFDRTLQPPQNENRSKHAGNTGRKQLSACSETSHKRSRRARSLGWFDLYHSSPASWFLVPEMQLSPVPLRQLRRKILLCKKQLVETLLVCLYLVFKVSGGASGHVAGARDGPRNIDQGKSFFQF